ncbi:MAG: hypothetical protein ACI9BG_001367 [Parasphingorhabdus sp.]|jgi:hypothetical protein|tara:strand:- start:34 stop:195 length:162 start_codon:yes stop_codon:yes gene_type:complete
MKEKILDLGYFIGICSMITVVAFVLILFTVNGLHIDLNEIEIAANAEALFARR